MAQTLEIERKFDVPDDLTVPDLTGAGETAGVVDRGRAELRATYFDTEDLALASAGITVRRRTGGDDEGWHLKLPTGKDRFELDLPLSRAKHTVPKEFRESLGALVGDAKLTPCCVVTTARRRYHLVDEDGVVLAEVADDSVTGERLRETGDEPASRTWREWEVELKDGDESLLDEVAGRLSDLGATPSRWRSKLARTLDVEVSSGPSGPDGLSGNDSAGTVLQARLAELAEELRLRDVAVRHDLPDAVHQLRVSVRRLRSLLASYRKLLDREVSEPLRDELKWLGDLLGEPRDAEVVRDLVLDALGELPDELVRGDVGQGVRRAFTREYSAGYERLATALDSARYWRLHDSLRAFVADPPWRGKATKPADEVLPRRVAHEWRRVTKRMAAADDVDPADEPARLGRLHETRKAAKRLRYAAEVAEPVVGKDARRLVKGAKRFQSHVGELHDSAVVRQRLLHLADASSPEPGAAFTLGALYGRVQRHGDELADQVPAQWRRLARKKRRRWLP